MGKKEISEIQINLVNGGFETGDYTGWTIGDHGLSYAVGSVENPPEGNYSSKFWGGDEINEYVYISQSFTSALPPRKLHIWYKFIIGDWNSATVEIHDSSPGYILRHSFTSASEWTELLLDVSESTYSPYHIYIRLTQPGGELHIDDVYLQG